MAASGKDDTDRLETLLARALELAERGDQAAVDAFLAEQGEHAERLRALLARVQGAGLATAPEPGPDAPVSTPERVGPYRILEVLGEGGMGTVYLAEQREPVRRRVALKVIKLGMDSKEVLARFEAERQALAMMNHDNIARVFDAGTTERGQPFFVMEHVPGLPLTEYCDQKRLTVRDRLELIRKVCAGVQHAHQKGIIHRDLKPTNVLVTADQGKPVPKIIDFGLARATDHRLTAATLFTAHGQFLGTPEYMSPEQAEMSSADIDTRTDIYSLGIMLYELLVGQMPIPPRELREAGLLEIQRRIREDEPSRPSTKVSSLGAGAEPAAANRKLNAGSLARTLRGDLDWITMKALAKDRDQRYATAHDLADDLDRYLHLQPVLAGPPSVGYRLRKLYLRHRISITAAATVVLALIAGAIGTVYFAVQAGHRADEAADATENANDKARVATDALAEAARERGRADRVVHRAGTQAAQFFLAAEERALAHASLLSCPREQRGWAWHRLWFESDQSVRLLQGHDTVVRCLAWNPQGTQLASGDLGGVTKVWDSATGESRQPLEGVGEVTALRFSPDSSRLAVTAGARLTVWSLATSSALWQTAPGDGPVAVAFSPDGSRLLGAEPDGDRLRVWDAETGESLGSLGEQTAAPDRRRMLAKFDGTFLLCHDKTRWVVVDAATGKTIERSAPGQLRGTGTGPRGLVVHFLVAAELVVVDAASGDPLASVTVEARYLDIPLALAHSPDLTQVAFTPRDARSEIALQRRDAKGETSRSRGHDDDVTSLAFDPRGQQLASCSEDGTVRLWRRDGPPPYVVRAGAGLHPQCGPAGRWIYAPKLPRIEVLETASGVVARTIELPGGRNVFGVRSQPPVIASSPRGLLVAVVQAAPELRIMLWGPDDTVLGDLPLEDGGAESLRGGPRPRLLALDDAGASVGLALRGGTVQVWTVATGTVRTLGVHAHPTPASEVTALAFDPAGTKLVSARSRTARVWDLRGGASSALEHDVATDLGVSSCAFSPDGSQLAVGTYGSRIGALWLWDLESGKKVFRVGRQLGVVQCIAFFPDGERIVTGAEDGAIAIHDARTGSVLATIRDGYQPVTSVAVTADGARIVACDVKGTFHVFPCRIGDAAELAAAYGR